MSPTLKSHFAEYAGFHATAGNQACHYLGIPLIVLAGLAFLSRIPLAGASGATAAEVLLVLLVGYYLSLDALLAVAMLVALAALDVVGRQLSLPLALGLFLLGWVFQLVGHYAFEKRSPAFFRNLVHLLVGPLWIVAKALRRT